MQLFIPALTSYRFSAARLHAAKYSTGFRVELLPGSCTTLRRSTNGLRKMLEDKVVVSNGNERFIQGTKADDELLDRTLKKFRSFRESIETWKAHLLRSINQDLC